MRLSWAQVVAGALTLAVVAGLTLLPGRLLGPDRPVHVAVPAPQAAVPSVQAVPPLAVRRPRATRPNTTLYLRLPHRVVTPVAPARATRARTVVRVSPARRLLGSHRTAVIRRLAPHAPFVRGGRLAPFPAPRGAPQAASSRAKTIAALGASLHKKFDASLRKK